MIDEKKIKPQIDRAEVAEQRRLLLSLQPRNAIIARMIERSLQAVEAGVPPLTPEEIREYLERK